jgi:RNA polymerase sigma factor (TIGR02999 family)
MANARDPDVTELLQAWGRGDLKARDDLLPLVYRDLQRRAEAYMQRERAGHTLQATALVHEAFLRLIKQNRIARRNRAQFFAAAAEMMRRILIDRARATVEREWQAARAWLFARLTRRLSDDA